ncbi:CLUMA_CG008028, isoform A [Clunio marinus]|uniref:CLUMA_CG008028, isoform A n=1 Tax=Clunio marinus TaxID=568069 RepID=A0A1J1I2L9_9DIPT|nr:CLUMA_CG008028, isoform A [Clunio marinus]
MIREDCGHEELSRCAKPLQLLQSTTDLSFAPKREELSKLCPEFHSGLRCIGSYTRRCMTQMQREEFNKIYQGTNELIKELCREGDYQNEFLKHSPCLQTVKPLHIKCAERYQQTMSSIFKASANQTTHKQQQHHSVHKKDDDDGGNDIENVKIVCCSFKEYLDCSEDVTRRTCGMDTGLFIRDFIHRMSDTLMQNYCEEYYKGSNHCPKNKFSMATRNSLSAFSMISVAVLATFTIHRIR